MLVYSQIVDSIAQEKKNSFAGQMSLFDLVSDEEKKEYEIRMPDVEEYDKEDDPCFRERCTRNLSERSSA